MTRMLSRLKKLPISSVNRNIAQANLVAAEKGSQSDSLRFCLASLFIAPLTSERRRPTRPESTEF